MDLIWGLFNMMDLIQNLRNFEKIKLPGNVDMILQTIDRTVNFKITEIPAVKEFLITYTPIIRNTLKGDGMFWVALLIMFTCILIFYTCLNMKRKHPCIEKISKKILDALMWSTVIRALLQGYFLMSKAQMKKLQEKEISASIIFKDIILIVAPIGSILILKNLGLKLAK